VNGCFVERCQLNHPQHIIHQLPNLFFCPEGRQEDQVVLECKLVVLSSSVPKKKKHRAKRCSRSSAVGALSRRLIAVVSAVLLCYLRERRCLGRGRLLSSAICFAGASGGGVVLRTGDKYGRLARRPIPSSVGGDGAREHTGGKGLIRFAGCPR
jgi:hypothetical protein